MTMRSPRLSPEAFARLVEQAIARIPESIRAYLDNILISVQQRPSADILEELGMAPDETLFGVYSGVPLIERSAIEPPLYPDTIFIFQEPLENACTTREQLLEEIEITVVHEIAHLVGFTDAELEALGYG
ncbi:metallopeptidase family protein [Desulfobulbus elongatus]|uniref:metallopeptidase family protein n=1 Tax=Desulfobulbus elongatus TaxID=53332 RepID=UPI000688E4CC|nr:metallopeptidase family protein [Desulfobulbus elongatus]